MSNSEHLAKLLEGVKAWNEWRKVNTEVRPDLNGADLKRANLREANLSGAYLREADLRGANLTDADLSGAKLIDANLLGDNLSGTNLRGANLGGANLYATKLSGANLSGANLSMANLSKANLCMADLGKARLTYATLVETNLEGANLTACKVYGISVWNAKLDGAKQSSLLITSGSEPAIQVDSLEVAQFIYLLLSNAKIRHVIDTIGKKAVLILGRFTPERKAVLDSIRDALRYLGFVPVLFDFEKPSKRDIHETIVTLAGLSRFIIADISDPKSVPQELGSIVPTLPSVPVQPLLQSGYEPWGMYDHIRRYAWVLPLFEYESQKTLLQDLELRVIAPAEEKAKELTRK